MVRSILAVLAGVILASVLIYGIQAIGHALHPPEKELKMADTEAIKEYIEKAPTWALLFVPLSYAVGSFGGGWLAALIARRAYQLHGLIVGAIQLVFGIANLFLIPHPLWLAILTLIVFIPAALNGAAFAKRLRSA